MSLIAYKKDFEVRKGFNFTRFIRVLDKENFHPFILHIEKLTDYHYELSFHHVIPSGRKGNIADEILLSECHLHLLESVGKIRFAASIKNSTIIVLGFFAILFSVPLIFVHNILAGIPLLMVILGQLLKYYWDVKRYHRIAKIALSLNTIKKKSKGK